MTAMRHGGNTRLFARQADCEPHQLIDFSANMNPLGPPEWLRPVIAAHISDVVHYPDPDCSALTEALCEQTPLDPQMVVWGNGASQLLYSLTRAIRGERVLIPVPCYSDYSHAAAQAGFTPTFLPLLEGNRFALDLDELARRLPGHELAIIGQPNNPNGLVNETGRLRALIADHPSVTFLIDEAFIDFTDEPSLIDAPHEWPANLVVLRSLTKLFCIPGLRLGYAVGPIPLIAAVRELLPAWSVNTLAQAVGARALWDQDYVTRSQSHLAIQRRTLCDQLSRLKGLTLYPSNANYLLIKLGPGLADAPTLARRMLKHGIAVRDCSAINGLDERFFRVAVRDAPENTMLVEALANELQAKSPAVVRRPAKKPALMLQGTSSNAGKSVMTAAFCRILLQDGYRVAPFKAQNMSLNAHVTRAGREMARAQVVQARACRIEPDVRMNPVLLKPVSQWGSQLILRGEALGMMDFKQYLSRRETIRETIHACYDELAAEYDVLVLEGAGSPGEVNLKARDLVNMHMARYAQAPVLLVGDIDRGGVYASFVGTMEVLNEWERRLVKGFLVNRFRGDASLLEDAHRIVAEHTRIPVLGVVPYLTDLGLPEEDSVSFKLGVIHDNSPLGDRLDIALIDLPHISNFTDFDALAQEPDVRLRVVTKADELGDPHVILLPGSRNVAHDLHDLRGRGLADAMLQKACEIVGICGGYQMMGAVLRDPHRLESDCVELNGLGLLDLTTTLKPNKTLTQCDALHAASGQTLNGYEIHHGESELGAVVPVIQADDGRVLAARHPERPWWGSYLHGLFDADGFRRWWLNAARTRVGLPITVTTPRIFDLEPALDRLAQVVRGNVDLSAVYREMGL